MRELIVDYDKSLKIEKKERQTRILSSRLSVINFRSRIAIEWEAAFDVQKDQLFSF